MQEIHTVFGAGQVGIQLARLLAQQGHAVRLVRRSAPGPAIDGVTWQQGDVTERRFADEACRGATSVYNCTNPPDYHKWDGVLVPLYRAVREAAGRAGARLVQLDNLYMYGRPERVPFDERTPMRPCTHMGELRKQLVDEMFEAHARGEVQVTSGRASDFFGPDTPYSMVLRPDILDRIHGGGTVYLLGNPDTPHAYCYTPDVARGLAVLGTHPAAVGRAWHLPVASTGTTREFLQQCATQAGTSIKIRRVPQWALRTVGVFMPLMSAVADMSYQWDIPYVIDDGDFRRTFAVGPTPLAEAIETTLAAHVRTKAKAAA